MLVLTGKPGEEFEIADGQIVLKILEIQNGHVRFGFQAPPEITIDRGKVAASKRNGEKR